MRICQNLRKIRKKGHLSPKSPILRKIRRFWQIRMFFWRLHFARFSEKSGDFGKFAFFFKTMDRSNPQRSRWWHTFWALGAVRRLIGNTPVFDARRWIFARENKIPDAGLRFFPSPPDMCSMGGGRGKHPETSLSGILFSRRHAYVECLGRSGWDRAYCVQKICNFPSVRMRHFFGSSLQAIARFNLIGDRTWCLGNSIGIPFYRRRWRNRFLVRDHRAR